MSAENMILRSAFASPIERSEDTSSEEWRSLTFYLARSQKIIVQGLYKGRTVWLTETRCREFDESCLIYSCIREGVFYKWTTQPLDVLKENRFKEVDLYHMCRFQIKSLESDRQQWFGPMTPSEPTNMTARQFAELLQRLPGSLIAESEKKDSDKEMTAELTDDCERLKQILASEESEWKQQAVRRIYDKWKDNDCFLMSWNVLVRKPYQDIRRLSMQYLQIPVM